MCLDPIVTSAIIGVLGVVVGFTGTHLYIARRKREAREYRIKRERYEELIRTIASGVHIVQTKGEKMPLQYKEKLDEVTNVLWLYASADVLRTLDKYISGDVTVLQNLIFAMRKDLKIKDDLKPSEINWFRAT